jgi:DNA-binding Lrp family transcriptional regulator
MLNETDLAIVNALEIAPRVEFTALAEALGMSPATIARRWESLVDSGQAWVTVTPGPRNHEVGWSAFISIEAEVGRQSKLAELLCAEPSFGSVLLTSGGSQFLIDFFAPSSQDAMSILTEVFGRLPGVLRRRINPITKIFRLSSHWRSGALDQPARRALEAQSQKTSRHHTPDGVDARLLEALSVDGRAGWQQIADAVDISPQTAKRRVTRLIDSGFMTLRCDTSERERAGLQEVIVDWSVPIDVIDEVGAQMAQNPMCRVSCQVLASANLTTTLWVHDFAQVQEHEAQVLAIAPRASVIERQTVLRSCKRMGQILDVDGTRRSTVPVSWWATS